MSEDELFKAAIKCFQAGRLDDAERGFKTLLEQQPNQVAALNMLGVLLASRHKYREAEPHLRSALRLNSNSDATFYNYGIVLKGLGRAAEALEHFSKALAINSAVAETWNNRGTIHNDLGHFAEAIADFDRAIALLPNDAAAFFNKAKSLEQLDRHGDALAAYDKALTLAPNLAEAWVGRGNVLAKLRRYDEALVAFDKALTLRPGLDGTWLGRGQVLYELRRYGQALEAYDKALALKPDLTSALLSRGHVLWALQRHHEASEAYDKSLTIDPNFAEAWLGRGNVAAELKKIDEALAAYDRALALQPDLESAWLGRGNLYFELKRYDDALAAYDQTLARKPDLAEAWNGRGNVYFELKRYDEALAAYDQALARKPDLAEAWNGRGNLYFELKRNEQALAAFDKAVALKPDLPGLKGARLHCKMVLCDWSNFDAECAQLIASVRSNNDVTPPFPLLAVASSHADQLQCARRWVANMCPSAASPMRMSQQYDHDRLRVGYVSADFRSHPVAQGAAELLERHDRSRFETIGLSIGPDDGSEIRARIVKAFDQFHDVRMKSDVEAAHLIKALEVDILVKVAPHTEGSRLGILAHRPAPIQVNGFSAWTSGADFIDYVLADPRTLPFGEQPYFSEQIVHVPDSYFPQDSTQQIAANTPTRAEVGLPDNGFVFCSFNRSYKLNPRTFDIWMRLLKRVEGSVLWLMQDNDQATVNLRREAAMRDIDPTRLVFASRMALLSEHLARHRLADLFLDTLPFGAHTTAKDALWAGLPVLTCRGDTFVGRIAASQLHAVGLPDLVTDNLDEYEAAALRLTQNPDELRALRDRLAANRPTHALFDTARLCRHFEAAYIEMAQRHRRGEPPQSFAVERQ